MCECAHEILAFLVGGCAMLFYLLHYILKTTPYSGWKITSIKLYVVYSVIVLVITVNDEVNSWY